MILKQRNSPYSWANFVSWSENQNKDNCSIIHEIKINKLIWCLNRPLCYVDNDTFLYFNRIVPPSYWSLITRAFLLLWPVSADERGWKRSNIRQVACTWQICINTCDAFCYSNQKWSKPSIDLTDAVSIFR